MILGNPVLRQVSKPIEVRQINEKLKILADDMLETMYERDGVGLAAPQIGILKRLIVIDIEDGQVYKVINPEIIESHGSCIDLEGCLSVPDRNGKVERPEKIKVKGLDLDGNEFEIDATGLLARAFCHEIDHLNGIMYIDRLVEDVNN
jgi:peptide deformylase